MPAISKSSAGVGAPSASDSAVSLSAAQMAYMLEGIDWKNPQLTWRPQSDIAAELAIARANASEDSALIAQQKLRIAKRERQIYGKDRNVRLS
jgi:hypothetical protein